MPEVCLINSKARPVRAANVAIDDWAVRYGWGLFETIRIKRSCPLFIDRHLNRLCSAAPLLELGDNVEVVRRRWHRDVAKAVNQSNFRDGIVNCYWTRGSLLYRVKPSRIVRVRPMPRYPRRALNLWVAPWRIEPTFPGVGVKTLAYFACMYAGLSARRSGFDEAIVLNTKDRVADGAASSIFMIRDGRIHTPGLDQGTLAGVTRSIVLEIARELKIPIREGIVGWKTLLDADAVFITSSIRGIVAVAKVGDDWNCRRVDNPILLEIIGLYNHRIDDCITRYQETR